MLTRVIEKYRKHAPRGRVLRVLEAMHHAGVEDAGCNLSADPPCWWMIWQGKLYERRSLRELEMVIEQKQ